MIAAAFLVPPAAASPPGKTERNVSWQATKAMTLLRSDPDSALTLLRRLLVRYPRYRRVVLPRLGDAYAYAGKVDSAIAAYEECLRVAPMDLSAVGSLGRLYIENGRERSADSLFAVAKKRSPARSGLYLTIGETFSSVGRYERALEVYREGREVLGDSAAFALQMGDAYRMEGRPRDALEEYIRYGLSPQVNASVLRERVMSLLGSSDRSNEEVQELLDLLAERTAQAPLKARLRLGDVLARAYLEAGLVEKALETALAADMASVRGAASVYGLALKLEERYQRATGVQRADLGGVLLRAYEAYLYRHPRDRRAPEVRLRLARLLEDLSRRGLAGKLGLGPEALRRALEEYDRLMKGYPRTAYAERALVGKMDLLLGPLHDPGGALDLARSALPWASQLRTRIQEGMIRALVAQGRFDEAEKECRRLVDLGGEGSCLGRYYLGLLLLRAGKADEARDVLTDLAEGEPASDYANDAIELAWAAASGQRGSAQALADYMDYLVAKVSYDTTAALAALEKVASLGPEEPLRPRALVALGEIYAALGRGERARKCFETYRRDYPDDPMLPDVYRKLGYVYEMLEGKKKEALQVYQDILLAYPDYLFLDEVRRDVERLRTALGEGR